MSEVNLLVIVSMVLGILFMAVYLSLRGRKKRGLALKYRLDKAFSRYSKATAWMDEGRL